MNNIKILKTINQMAKYFKKEKQVAYDNKQYQRVKHCKNMQIALHLLKSLTLTQFVEDGLIEQKEYVQDKHGNMLTTFQAGTIVFHSPTANVDTLDIDIDKIQDFVPSGVVSHHGYALPYMRRLISTLSTKRKELFHLLNEAEYVFFQKSHREKRLLELCDSLGIDFEYNVYKSHNGDAFNLNLGGIVLTDITIYSQKGWDIEITDYDPFYCEWD